MSSKKAPQSYTRFIMRRHSSKGECMHRLLAAVLLLLTLAGSALAYTCTTQTVWQNGRLYWCQTCCTSWGSCHTDCY